MIDCRVEQAVGIGVEAYALRRLPIHAVGLHFPVRRGRAEYGEERRIADDAARFLQNIAFEVATLQPQQSSLVIVSIWLAQQVHGSRLRTGQSRIWAVGIDETFAQGKRLPRPILRPHPDRTVEDVIGMEQKRALAVPMLDQIPCRIENAAASPRVNVFSAQRVLGQIVDILEGEPSQCVSDGQQIALNIVGRGGDVPIGRRSLRITLDALCRPSERINRYAGRRVPMALIAA